MVWEKFENIKGPKGEKGDTGSVASASIATLPPGSAATVEISGVHEPHMHFGVPKGEKGDTGPAGALSSASAESVPAENQAAVEMSGTDEVKHAHFKIPRGLPGVNAVPSAEAVGTYLSTPDSPTRPGFDAGAAALATDSGSAFSAALESTIRSTAVPRDQSEFTNVAVGQGTLEQVTSDVARYNEGFGINALAALTRGRYNTAVGYESLFSLNPDNNTDGSRNTAVGSNTQRFNRKGVGNVSMGRNSLQCNETGSYNLSFGVGAMGGNAPLGFDGVIQNQHHKSHSQNVAIGYEALKEVASNGNVAVGHLAGRNTSRGQKNVAVGFQAMHEMGKDDAPNLKRKVNAGWSVTYTIAAGVLTVTYASHGLAVGDMVRFEPSGQEYQLLTVSAVPDASSFVLGAPLVGVSDTSGTGTIVWRTGSAAAGEHDFNVAVGVDAMRYVTGTEGINARRNTAVGAEAMVKMQDGSNAVAVSGSTCLGTQSYVSGDNQVQLGANYVDVYSAKAIQIRSDARDKTDVRDTSLGLEFISALRPREWRFDFRTEYVDDETGELAPSDGSKAGKRFHQGVIAQEVEQVMSDLGVDFAGLQHHSVNGGNDVYTIAYEQFIGPLIAAVQELSARVADLESRTPAVE